MSIRVDLVVDVGEGPRQESVARFLTWMVRRPWWWCCRGCEALGAGAHLILGCGFVVSCWVVGLALFQPVRARLYCAYLDDEEDGDGLEPPPGAEPDDDGD